VKAIWSVALSVLSLWFSLAAAQGEAAVGEAAEDVAVSFGFAGEIVADAWNPLRVTLRDLESAELVLELDVGSLRSGPRGLTYRAQLPGGQGLSTFEDDVYLPSWQSFSWLVRTPERVLASGTVERRRVDDVPVQLAVAREVGAGNRFFGEAARVVDVSASELPERAAAYDGVSSVLLLPGSLPPTPGALVAAATAGSRVLLIGDLGSGYDDLLALTPTGVQRLGAGWLVRVEEAGRAAVQGALSEHPRLAQRTLVATLVSDELTEAPEQVPVTWLLVGLGGYALLAALLLRWGSAPGLLAALLLAAAAALGAGQLRPSEPLLTRSRSLNLGAGELALTTDLQTLFSFPAQRARVARAAHPLPITAAAGWTVGREHFELELDAHSSVVLAGRPHLAPAPLGWQAGRLVNRSAAPLGDVFIVGRGQQPPLPADGTLEPTRGNLLAPDLYAELAPLLPDGSALARSGGAIFVALPEAVSE
jgi:hypothetical protein